MYLDTDIILALIKDEDWLKPHINLKRIKNPTTSVFAIIEAEIVLLREYGKEHVFPILNNIKSKKVKIISLDEKILKKALEMLKKYERLNIFDSVHAAYSIIKNDKIISTDNIFDEIEEIERIDPRSI
jgi:predicted nucleic acid-binding protein